MALYPLASPGMVLVINNLLLSVPYMTRLEHKEGSFRALWILLFIYGLLPGMAYVVLVAVLVSLHHSLQGSLVWTVSEGFSVFAVALSVASVLQEEEEHGQVQDHMLLGAIRVPGRAVPALILVFYFFLAPNTSILLHLCAALAGYLYATHRLPSVLLPIDESIRQQEEEGWLQKIAGTRRYVRADGSGPYLPIHSTAPLPPYAFSTAPSPSAPPSTTPSAVRAFPGEGNRLGDQ
ncbi:hypothetical protein BDF14DRAFT_1218251 [Spinellus fusiger]|nr:hypothetical protein BDF14DRAFT_1218251 [Spinellus fusiger]